jgi:hypothetical protein
LIVEKSSVHAFKNQGAFGFAVSYSRRARGRRGTWRSLGPTSHVARPSSHDLVLQLSTCELEPAGCVNLLSDRNRTQPSKGRAGHVGQEGCADRTARLGVSSAFWLRVGRCMYMYVCDNHNFFRTMRREHHAKGGAEQLEHSPPLRMATLRQRRQPRSCRPPLYLFMLAPAVIGLPLLLLRHTCAAGAAASPLARLCGSNRAL